jgi:hypothetical protein
MNDLLPEFQKFLSDRKLAQLDFSMLPQTNEAFFVRATADDCEIIRSKKTIDIPLKLPHDNPHLNPTRSIALV